MGASDGQLLFDGKRWVARQPVPSPQQQLFWSNSHAASPATPAAPSRPHRSASNNSSTSSDILVASLPPAASTNAATASSTSTAPVSGPPEMMETRSRVFAKVVDGRTLIVHMKGYHNKQFLARVVEGRAGRRASAIKPAPVPFGSPLPQASSDQQKIQNDPPSDDDGPNHRGTYSRAYVQRHPEMKWVHRGQGRYLPASNSQKTNTVPKSIRTSSASIAELPPLAPNGDRFFPNKSSSTAIDHLHSSPETPQGSVTTSARARAPGMTDSRSPDVAQQNSARSRRQTKISDTPDTGRRSSRNTASHNLNYYIQDEDEEEIDQEDELERDDRDDESDETDHDSDSQEIDPASPAMTSSKEQTYDREYVDAHPDEVFYHTGNGWYKKGDRPTQHRYAKRRDSEGHAVARTADGRYKFDPRETIHVSQLRNYPGVEFHHCGNGWYRPGPDHSGHRISTVVPQRSDNGMDADMDEDTTVDKAYILDHPEIEWVHRGNGRYKRKSNVANSSARITQGSSVASESEDDEPPVRSRRVINNRSERQLSNGSMTEQWASTQRRKSIPTVDNTVLYSKAYVKAHPEESFHHRGQGRYARGPRPKLVDDSREVEAQETLVDTEYVEAHPSETFHHRGQGRWARGLPPPGASNKVAIRGPGARERTETVRSIDVERDDSNVKLPPMSALLLKADGPDKFPHLEWHYRGGGKWARITKAEWQNLQETTHARAKPQALRTRNSALNALAPSAPVELPGYARKRRRRFSPEQDDETMLDGDSIMDLGQSNGYRQSVSRAALGGLGKRTVSKTGYPEAPTPKPRVMTLDEDVLDETDLPSLYKDNWSPSDSEAEDEAGRIVHDTFPAMNRAELLLKPLIKHDPRARPTENLLRLAEYGQSILDLMQREFLESDKITAEHARIARKPAKGGRLPVDPLIFEDRKEADLYDYHFDMRKLGFQDPIHQRIQRDAEGRELRGRRHRAAAQHSGTLPGWDFGDDSLGAKRAVKPVTRFDGIADQPRRRGRYSNTADDTAASSRAPSTAPNTRAGTPPTNHLSLIASREYVPQTKGRWAGHIPKRIQELRRESEAPSGHGSNSNSTNNNNLNNSAGSSKHRDISPSSVSSRKGRPPGSKNLHKRRDAGIKKGPRKPKTVESSSPTPSLSSVRDTTAAATAAPMSLAAIVN